MRPGRTLLVPSLLVGAGLAVFHRAYTPGDLALAALGAIVVGGLVGLGFAATWIPWPAGVAALLLAVPAASGVISGEVPHVDLVPNAFVLFLTVGLPAHGLRQLLVVPFVLGTVAAASAVASSARRATLLSIAGPFAVLALGSLLVLPVGFGWAVPLVFGVAASTVLLLDARTDVSSMPPLAGTDTEAGRQVVFWRPLIQFLPAVVAVVGLTTALPHNRTVDVRRFVHPRTERFADANPLAVAGRAPRTTPEDARPLARIAVDGPAPGRLRVAVLDDYTGTGWHQSADFSITGGTLAVDPLYRVVEDDGADLAPAQSSVTVTGIGSSSELHAVPTAGRPRTVVDPEAVRFAPAAGVLLADDPTLGVEYRTDVSPPAADVAHDVTVGRHPAELARCPKSPTLEAVSGQLGAGTTRAIERLSRIENFLKVRRVYDPGAPGGQTLGAVERFLEQDYARGNLEVFVTAHALLARCAGVPVRVVIGLPEPIAAEVTYTDRDLTAWIETPLVRSGWTTFDPLPTPDEQRQQAQLARQTPPPPPPPDDPPPVRSPRRVEPVDVERHAPFAALVLAALVLGILGLGTAWTMVAPRVVLGRRRRCADPTLAVARAWSAVVDALVDRDLSVDPAHTPKEVTRIAAGHVPVVVPRLLEAMAPIVDRARYSGAPSTHDEARLAWAHAEAVLDRLPSSGAVRTAPLRHPGRMRERVRSTRDVARRRHRWRGELPDTSLLTARATPTDIPNVTVAARIGEGSTGTVFRGFLDGTREPVAVKVFRYGPGDVGFDLHRFDWEVRIAKTVSGLAHLPVVHDAGITPTTQRPYLISSLHDGGTLLDRVRRGGPMTEAEVVRIGADLAVALSTLHQLGVVHADVKPENVFSGREGWVLGDLGSAWLRASRGPAATLTPPYAAPEVWRGGPPTPLADVFSLALTMLFAVTGQVPTASITPSREDIAAAFPLHPVLQRALEPDARRRPRSAADFARSLRPELAPSHTGPGLTTLRLPPNPL
ncbi:MAG TPA: transglutaminaseTgpA domain-containing protein [Acidimicrobiales bacterium]|nr:transglutaminaseTgpA domain-containing protein [Acidimicrobiales bacterium]